MHSTTDPERADAAPAWSADELSTDVHTNAQKADKVRRMFASIAHAYDLNNRLHSFGRDGAWRRCAVRMAGVRDGEHVLDVACGTGELTRAFARTGAGRIVGADYTGEMLDIARSKPPARRADDAEARIEYVQADAMALPFDDASFDVVSIAFGIRNVAEPRLALAEFHRVLRPGGRLVVLEFDTPRFPPIAWANRVYTGWVMPRTATWISRDRSGAYAYLPKSVGAFATREALSGLIGSVGFVETTMKPLTFGVCVCHRGVRAG